MTRAEGLVLALAWLVAGCTFLPQPPQGPPGFGPIRNEDEAVRIAMQLTDLVDADIRSIERGPVGQLVRMPVVVFTDDDAARQEQERRSREAWVVSLLGDGAGDCQGEGACPLVPTLERLAIDVATGELLARTQGAAP